ncbi:MAG: ABC transporter permease [Candidatus Micrarchaeia archaeon]
MRLSDIVWYSFTSLRHREIRSWLTILGIVIGIASVVALISIGEGFQNKVNEQLSALGSNTIFITPSSSTMSMGSVTSAGKLYQKDVDRLKRIPEISDIARLITGRVDVQFRDKELPSSVAGIEPGVFEKTTAIEVSEGRFFVDGDRHVAVVGATVANSTFGPKNKVALNSYLLMNGTKYRVIGILNKSGGGFGMAGSQDGSIYITFDDARPLFKDTIGADEVGAIVVRTHEGSNTDEVVEAIKTEIDASHKVKPDKRDYSVVDPKSIQAAVSSVLSLITLFLGAIAGISLLVGGLAIASSMFTSVLERTHEIGVLKAVGANRDDINRLFLFESGAVGAIGGLLGTAIGLSIVYIGSFFGLPASINPYIAAFCIAFAFAIGMVSGYFPARQAAELSPVDALRYE